MKSRVIGKMLASTLALWLAACDIGQSITDVEHVYRAREQLEQDNLRVAVIELKNALSKNPDNADARLMLGELYLGAGDGASAEKELQRARQLGVPLEAVQVPLARAWFLQRKFDEVLAEQAAPALTDLQRAELMVVLGDTHMRRGMLREAEENYARARDLAPAAAGPLVGQALVASSRRELDRAEQLLDEALRLEGEDSAAWSLRGDLEHYQGRLEEAVAAYGRALGARREQLGNLEKRAVLLSYLGRFDEARTDIARMRRLNVNHPAIDYASGMLALQERKYDDARIQFENLLNKLESYRDAVLQLGVANLAVGNPQQAELYLARAFSRNPNYIPGRILLAVARLEKGDAASAVQLLEPVVARDPGNHRAQTLLASALLRLGRSDEALEHLRKLVEQNPESPELLTQLGMGMLIHGDYEEGVQLLETILVRTPELAQADIVLVMAHLYKGAFEQAVKAAREFASRHSEAPMPLVLEGMGQLGLADRAAARLSFEAALRMVPDDPAANHRLAVLYMEDGDFASARKHYERILVAHPDHLSTLQYLAMLEARAGNEKDLVAVLERAIRAHPTQVDFQVQLGRLHLAKGQPERVLTDLLPERERNPRHAGLRALLGEAYLAMQIWPSARSEFSTVVDLMPERAQGYYWLALVCDRTDDRSCVKRQLERALEAEPGHLASRIEWGHVLIAERRYEEAEDLLRSLREDAGSHMRILVMEGALAMARDQPERAARAYAKAMSQAPSTTLVIELARVKWVAGEREDATALLEDWARDHIDDIHLLLVRANYSMLQSREREAMEHYLRVIGLVPGQVLALNNLANLVMDTDPAQAETYARRALEEIPDNPLVMDTLVQVLLAQGKDKEARVLIDDFLTRSHRGPDGRYLDALWQRHDGRGPAAMRELVNLLAETTDFALVEQARQLLRELSR
jgi:putative PEP-CTERM system TPR-repeat lipoprotein